jgi:hypothetical protein
LQPVVVIPVDNGSLCRVFNKLPRGSFFIIKRRNFMKRITQFYLNKASYIAMDEQGNKIDLEVDYWDSFFNVSQNNKELEKYAAKLLGKKHRVNFIEKMYEEE